MSPPDLQPTQAGQRATDPKPTVAIAGATGFVGSALCRALAPHANLIGLTRSPRLDVADDPVTWRVCDLFSLRALEQALEGAEVAIYLVHSMLPAARLTQGSFADLDLLLADNFARAARRAGVRQVVYVGGLVPDTEALSEHLQSRFEVESALSRAAPNFTALRCGIILGRGSSSLWILQNLVRRLPVMVLPRWTHSPTQPIAVDDLVRAVRRVLDDPEGHRGAYDIGGPEVLTYQDLMQRIAAALGVRRLMFPTGVFSPGLSRLWVGLFGSAPRALVAPLIESLRHEMVVRDNPLQRALAPESIGLDEALDRALGSDEPVPAPPSSIDRRSADQRTRTADRSVRSVQRLPLPKGRDAAFVAREYAAFLPRFAGSPIRVESDPDGSSRIFTAWGSKLLMELRHAPERSTPDRQVLDVVGGALVRRDGGPAGRLEFREVGDGRHVLAAVHDFRPALPWFIYQWTQARTHLRVMSGFARHLARWDEHVREHSAAGRAA